MAVHRRQGPQDELRWSETAKRVRAKRGGRVVADSERALLVWEPGMPYPWYAFPHEDISASGTPIDDPDLAGYVLLRHREADEWLEEEDPIHGHPRDPFARVDVRRSSRRVRVAVDGRPVAESRRPVLLFETGLPTRYYLPREDVRMDLLEPSSTRTFCPYKGHADHFSALGVPDVAWTYLDLLVDGPPIHGLIAFYPHKADIAVSRA